MTSAASAGCHRLIRDYDATLVTTADEIAELLGRDPKPAVSTPDGSQLAPIESRPRSAEETRLLDATSTSAPRQVTDIAARSGLSVAAVQSLLGALELDGRVVERERGWLKKKPHDPGAPPPALV